MTLDRTTDEMVGATGKAVNLTLLDSSTGAACLDGSQYGFYFVKSTTGSKKWTISIQGGGWCYDEEDCLGRASTRLGSSKFWVDKPSTCGCMNTVDDGLDADCNCIFMPYGDGASFSGYREDPWPVPGKPGSVLHFRGIRNLDATLQFAKANLGLADATEMVVTGSSAGGLSTFLHADRVADFMGEKVRTTAAPVVGFFLDHDDYSHDNNTYTDEMAYVYKMQNLTVGALKQECLDTFGDKPHYCFMSPHMQQFVKVPYFMFNSKYDAWQMNNILRAPCYASNKHPCSKEEQNAVLQYGKDFLAQFAPVQKESQNGAMITSCICHGCQWAETSLENRTSYQHYAAWHAGNDTGAAAIHIDTRGPNGDGALDKGYGCMPFP